MESLEKKVDTRLNIQDMTELIRIHDAYKGLSKALFGVEISLMYYEGYMGELGRIYEVINRNVLESMKDTSSEILADTSIDPEIRANVIAGENN